MAFYGPDILLPPILIDSTNQRIVVTEDPNGTPSTFSASISTTAALAAGAQYYGFRDSGGNIWDPAEIISNSRRTLDAKPIYTAIADKLTADSPNGWTYSVESATPAGSSLVNSGLKLVADSNLEFRLDFADGAFDMDPRLFGWGEGHSSNEVSSDPASTGDPELTGPYSRYYCWQSPTAAYDKRHEEKHRAFQSSQRGDAYRWRWKEPELKREVKYRAVAGAHVWPDDRADRQDEADRAGLPLGDANNALKQLFELAAVGDQRVLIGHNEAESAADQIALEQYSAIEAVALDPKWASSWRPHKNSGPQYEGEKYDLMISYTAEDPDDYVDPTPYRH